MRRSSCTLMMLLLACSSFLPAPARAENDTRSISQRITELRNRLDSFCGNPAKSEAQSSKASVAASEKAHSAIKAAQADSTVGTNAAGKGNEKSIDGEKFVLLPTDASQNSSQGVTPEGESSAIEHAQNVKMTVLFHDAEAPNLGEKKSTAKSNATSADATTAVLKKP